MELSGSQLKSLQEVLLAAFPSQGALAQVVRYHLDEHLDAIAEGANHSERIFKHPKSRTTGSCEQKETSEDSAAKCSGYGLS